jgi:hypothetical protein
MNRRRFVIYDLYGLWKVHHENAVHCVVSVIMTRSREIIGVAVWDGTLDTFTVYKDCNQCSICIVESWTTTLIGSA